jgi:hypothetical protein
MLINRFLRVKIYGGDAKFWDVIWQRQRNGNYTGTDVDYGLERFATVSVEQTVHTDNSHPESVQHEHE